MSIRHLVVPTMAGAILLLGSSGVRAQESTNQQKCLNALNRDGGGVARTQGKENTGCLHLAATGKLVGSAQTCLSADGKGKVAKAKGKTSTDATKSCGTPPDFGFTSVAAVNKAAAQQDLLLMGDVYGATLDPAVISCASSKKGCACQQKVSTAVEFLAAAKITEFVSCKKAALKSGATSAAALAACVSDTGTAGSIAADSKSKIAKKVAALNTGITKSCDTPGVTAGAFPGACTGLSGTALGTCLDQRVECRVCLTINAMDGLAVDCDLFDDGLANTSCVPPPPPAPGFKVALAPKTTGLFNFAPMKQGLDSSDFACDRASEGSHTCTYAELQAADTAGQLVGAVDTANNAVTEFWAIDPAQPGTRQCDNPIPWGYQTAHTGHFGDRVPLTGGHLGALQPSTLCLTPSWVGCCV